MTQLSAAYGARASAKCASELLFAESTLSRLKRLFGQAGGIENADALSVRLQCRTYQPISLLARWIVNREIVSFEANGQRWVPLFQFIPASMALRVGVQCAVAELRGVLDDTELCEWFVTPNTWIDGRLPALLNDDEADQLIQASRGDRFVAAG